jgi:magnesium-transporting ATPase (P-type)
MQPLQNPPSCIHNSTSKTIKPIYIIHILRRAVYHYFRKQFSFKSSPYKKVIILFHFCSVWINSQKGEMYTLQRFIKPQTTTRTHDINYYHFNSWIQPTMPLTIWSSDRSKWFTGNSSVYTSSLVIIFCFCLFLITWLQLRSFLFTLLFRNFGQLTVHVSKIYTLFNFNESAIYHVAEFKFRCGLRSEGWKPVFVKRDMEIYMIDL